VSEPLPSLLSISTDIARQTTLLDVLQQLTELRAQVAAVLQQQMTLQQQLSGFTVQADGQLAAFASDLSLLAAQIGVIMSEDTAAAGVAASLTTDAASLTTAVSALQGLVTTLTEDVNNNPDAVSPATMTALQNAQAAVDAIRETASGDVTADTPPAPPAGG
jgi:hypothetical protein